MSGAFNFRIEDDFKEALQSAAGGQSLAGLIRTLGLLLLSDPIPEEENGDNLNGRIFSQLEAQVSEWEGRLYQEGGDLAPSEWNAVRSTLDQVHRFTQPTMRKDRSVNRHRGLLLAGRLSMMWFEYCDRAAPPVSPPPHLRA